MRLSSTAIGLCSLAPAGAFALAPARYSLGVSVLVVALCSAIRGGAALLAPRVARGYVLSRLCSLRYLLPALAFPMLGGIAIARFGALAWVVVALAQIQLAHRYQACWTRPGALRIACLPALLGGVHCALECLALSGFERAFGGRLLYAEQSRRQRIVLLEHGGALELLIDGELQFRTSDELLYHRGLLEPGLALIEPQAHVLVMGGGDGLAARDLLRTGRVARVTIVDWDPSITRLFRSDPRLRALNHDALRDPRVEIVHRDIRSVLDGPRGSFDLIVGDLTDPEPTGDGAVVGSSAFYLGLRAQLSCRGAIVTHTSSEDGWAARAIPAALEQAGFRTHRYAVEVPSFERVTYVLGAQHAIDPERLPEWARAQLSR